jgi:L-cysteine/cystine lyase
MTANLEQFRRAFPALENKAYFNYGGQGTLPQPAFDRIVENLAYIQKKGPFSLAMSNWVTAACSELRSAIAQELGTVAANITLTENVSAGCNIAMWGIDWQGDDRLLISDSEHPSIIGATKELARRHHIAIDTFALSDVKEPAEAVDRILAAVSDKTRLIAVSHVLWNTGLVVPVERLAAALGENRSLILVDGAQSVGMLPLSLDALNVDFYAFTGHKWWCGPEGVGGFYTHPTARETLHPTYIGWRSLDYQHEDLPLLADNRQYETATSSYPLYLGLREAIGYHRSYGNAETRYQSIVENAVYLWQKLGELPVLKLAESPPKSGLVTFQIADIEPAELVKKLEEKDFFIREILFPHCLRVCVHYFTTKVEIDSLVAEIKGYLD